MHSSTSEIDIVKLGHATEADMNLIVSKLIVPEPTARSAVPGVSPGRGLLISL